MNKLSSTFSPCPPSLHRRMVSGIIQMSSKAASAALLAVSLFSAPAWAETEESPDYAAATWSGDWGGTRSAAWQAGWSFDATLKADVLRNRGGANDGSGTMRNLDLRLQANLEKIAGWEGATAYVHVLDSRGDQFNSKYPGSLAGVSNIEVPVPTTRLFHAWLQQNFLDDRLSLLAGLYPIDSEFFVMESASLLINPTFGTPADIALTRGPSIFNNSAFGLRGKWLSPDRTLYGMAAVLDGVPNDPDHLKKTAVHLRGREGAMAIAEFGWMPLELGHTFEPVEPVGGLMTPDVVQHEKYGGLSKFGIGFWGYTKGDDDLVDTDASGQMRRHRQHGAYLFGERTLLSLGKTAGRDITLFGRLSSSDGNSMALDRSYNLGFRLRGPLGSRPDDALVFGATRSRLAAKYRSAQLASSTETTPYEDVYELTYRAAITKYFAVQPTFQRIHRPGGNADEKPATILGLRVEIAL